MAFVYADRVKELTTTTGTGAVSLGGATAGFRSFAAGVGVSNECFYGIVHTLDNTWEVGRGTVGAGTFSRDTVFTSSNSNLLVNFAAGDKIVFTTNPAFFYTNALDAAAHALLDHTTAPLNLLDAAAHETVDHTAAPLNLLNVTGHEAVNHTLAPFSLLDAAGHQAINHTIAPFNLLDATQHNSIDHTTAPLSLLSIANHAALDHSALPGTNVGEDNPTQVSSGERTAGTETNLRSFSPEDVAVMAGIHGGAAAQGKVVAVNYVTTRTLSTGVALIPFDNTIPQISEGNPVMTLIHTPQNAANTLRIEVITHVDGGGGQMTVALFDGSVDAIATGGAGIGGPGVTITNVSFTHEVLAGGVSPITFTVRAGASSAGTFTFNGVNGAARYGGTSASSIVITEIAP